MRSAFVIMPIKENGTAEHTHFRTLYDEWIAPALAAKGYRAVRADDVQESGAITKTIVTGLAEADIVIADLTDLNPNVFYELGVRHALRGYGTMMMLDENRTSNIPFDLSAYRVIKYSADLVGIGRLRSNIEAFAANVTGRAGSKKSITDRDNPVHDWLPALPLNALAAADGSTEGILREELSAMRARLARYESVHGQMQDLGEGRTPTDSLGSLLRSVQAGATPVDLMSRARVSFDAGDRQEFLQTVIRLLESSAGALSERDYLTLSRWAAFLGLSEARQPIYQIARTVFPTSADLREAELQYFAHSRDPTIREKARAEMLSALDIAVVDGEVVVPDEWDTDKAGRMGIMLDAYHADDLHEDALAISAAVAMRHPDFTACSRNYARALAYVGRAGDALQWYVRALSAPDADDTSALWLGNALNNEKRYVDAAEAYLLACLMDPTDAENFAYASSGMQRAITDRAGLKPHGRLLPNPIGYDEVKMLLIAARSAPGFGHDAQQRCVSVARDLELEQDFVALLIDNLPTASTIRLPARRSLVAKLWLAVASELTRSVVNDAQIAEWANDVDSPGSNYREHSNVAGERS